MPSTKSELASDCIILTGPTASGKTALGIRIAQRLNADILSADSVAVYKGLDIGAAKPTLEEKINQVDSSKSINQVNFNHSIQREVTLLNCPLSWAY